MTSTRNELVFSRFLSTIDQIFEINQSVALRCAIRLLFHTERSFRQRGNEVLHKFIRKLAPDWALKMEISQSVDLCIVDEPDALSKLNAQSMGMFQSETIHNLVASLDSIPRMSGNVNQLRNIIEQLEVMLSDVWSGWETGEFGKKEEKVKK